MTRTKKAAIVARNKKHKKLPLDPTPWEELSKNIRGRFKSKIQTQDEQKNQDQLLSSEECVNSNSINKLNRQEKNSAELKEVLSNNFDEPENKMSKKIKIELDSSFESILIPYKQEGNISITSVKNDCESPNINGQELLPVKQLSRYQRKKLMKQKKKMSDSTSPISTENLDAPIQSESKKQKRLKRKELMKQKKKMSGLASPISTEKSDGPIQSKAKKLSEKVRLERKKVFQQKRLERRKELGIMMLPKNIENRLLRIRKALRRKNLPPEEIKSIMRSERSKAQDEFRKSHSTQICFNCRKPGHLVANCPSIKENGDICIKCGSTEHKYIVCEKKCTGFPFATCFICRGQGHISRDCPNNEHGIYPKEESSITLYTMDNSTSIDDEVMDTEHLTKKIKSEEPKVVTF